MLKILLQRRLPFSNEANMKVSRRRLSPLMRLGLTYLLRIIQQILADVLYLKKLHGPLKEIVTASYIQSLEYSHSKPALQARHHSAIY